MIQRFNQTNGMGYRATDNEHVHDLMARTVYIEDFRIPPLRDTGRIDGCASPVQHAETDEVSERHLLVLFVPAVEEDAVESGNESREAQEGEHDRSHESRSWGSELGLHGECAAAYGGCGSLDCCQNV